MGLNNAGECDVGIAGSPHISAAMATLLFADTPRGGRSEAAAERRGATAPMTSESVP